MKKIAMVLSLLSILVLIAFIYQIYFANTATVPVDYPFNGTYVIGGETIALHDGFSEVPIALGSSMKLTTRYFGNPVSADLDNDGTKDAAFLMVQDQGGSGIFYYVTAQLNTKHTPTGVKGVLLGDRITPKSTDMKGDVLVVTYLDRNLEDSFDMDPTVEKVLKLQLNPQTLEFETIAD